MFRKTISVISLDIYARCGFNLLNSEVMKLLSNSRWPINAAGPINFYFGYNSASDIVNLEALSTVWP